MARNEFKLYRVIKPKYGENYLTDYNETDLEEGETCTPVTIKDVKAHELVTFLDMDAENSNYHDFVGVHKWLAKTIYDASKSGIVTRKVMWEIIKHGGLYNN